MTLKQSIDNLVASNKELKNFIEATKIKNDADQALADYATYLNKSNYNSALSLSFGYLLQFSNDPKFFEQFELKDIEQLYDSYLELHNKCSDIYIDAANFADAVMDNKEKAKQIVEIGINKLKIQLTELEELEKDLIS